MSAPVLTVPQMRNWENATWAAGIRQKDVIRQAGRAVAAQAMRMSAPADAVVILAGRGHNGDDARAAAEAMHSRDVVLINVEDPARALEHFTSSLDSNPTLLIDGLFGIGLNKPVEGAWRDLIAAMNRTAIPTLAIDVPSGLDAETGRPLGIAVRADVTLTLGAPKRGLLATTAWPHVGRLMLARDIGLVECGERSDLGWTMEEDFAGLFPRRAAHQHKGSFGHVAVVGGSVGYHGAAILAANGALAARPGLVTVFCPESVYAPVAGQLRQAMVHPWRPRVQSWEGFSAIVIGPGLAGSDVPEELKRDLSRCWQALSVPMVADASALDWLPRGLASSKLVRVVTPHPGEAARMLYVPVEAVQKDRPETVREISRRFGECWVVLKGHQTVVGRMFGEVYFNSSGHPGLAQGGSGDVLAGFLGGLLAQPLLGADPERVIRYAVWEHGAAAERLAARGNTWGTDDLAMAIASS